MQYPLKPRQSWKILGWILYKKLFERHQHQKDSNIEGVQQTHQDPESNQSSKTILSKSPSRRQLKPSSLWFRDSTVTIKVRNMLDGFYNRLFRSAPDARWKTYISNVQRDLSRRVGWSLSSILRESSVRSGAKRRLCIVKEVLEEQSKLTLICCGKTLDIHPLKSRSGRKKECREPSKMFDRCRVNGDFT